MQIPTSKATSLLQLGGTLVPDPTSGKTCFISSLAVVVVTDKARFYVTVVRNVTAVTVLPPPTSDGSVNLGLLEIL